MGPSWSVEATLRGHAHGNLIAAYHLARQEMHISFIPSLGSPDLVRHARSFGALLKFEWWCSGSLCCCLPFWMGKQTDAHLFTPCSSSPYLVNDGRSGHWSPVESLSGGAPVTSLLPTYWMSNRCPTFFYPILRLAIPRE